MSRLIPAGQFQDYTANNFKLLQEKYQAMSALMGRMSVFNKMGKSYGTQRDLYTSLGYITQLTFGNFEARWQREDISSTIISEPPRASWRMSPEISEIDSEEDETAFEKAWKELEKLHQVFSYMRRIDIISGIGCYGVLYIGFSDGGAVADGVNPKKGMELLYLRPYKEGNAEIKNANSDPTNERYGKPEIYSLANTLVTSASTVSASFKQQTIPVHWSRCLHVAEGLQEDDIFGTPRLQAVFNRLQSLDYILGGSGEMFWRGAFPGYNFKLDPEANVQTQDLDDAKTQIEEYVHKLSRYLRLQGIDVQELSPQVASPKDHFDIQISVISAVTRIPKRILTGSERGELASSQDEKNWNSFIMDRQNNYLSPFVIRPFIDRMIEFGVLPEPAEGYQILWPDLNAPGDKEKVEIAVKKTEAVSKYASSPGADHVMPRNYFLTEVLGIPVEDLEKIQSELDEMFEQEELEIEEDEARLAEDEEEDEDEDEDEEE